MPACTSRSSTSSRSASGRRARTRSVRCAPRSASPSGSRPTASWRRSPRVKVELFGSLGFTGKGHGSDRAIVLGLEGDEPATVDVDSIARAGRAVEQTKRIKLLGKHAVELDPDDRARSFTAARSCRCTRTACGSPRSPARPSWSSGSTTRSAAASSSITPARRPMADAADQVSVPYPFNSGDELLQHAVEHGMSDLVADAREREGARAARPRSARACSRSGARWKRA